MRAMLRARVLFADKALTAIMHRRAACAETNVSPGDCPECGNPLPADRRCVGVDCASHEQPDRE